MNYEEKIKEIARLMKKSNKILALTGAGISTESGIPDYRSPGTGTWEKQDPAKTASHDALYNDTASFYSTNLKRWTAFNNAKPNDAHHALALMEKKGHLDGVITQNIDGLHKKAGSIQFWEVHGHLRTCHCMDCRTSHSFEYLEERFDKGENPPLCTKCGGKLRPDIVLFGDQMSGDYYQVTHEMEDCELLLVVGSSLTVYPVAGLPDQADQFIIINNTSTPYDNRATVVVHESAGKVLQDIVQELGLKES